MFAPDYVQILAQVVMTHPFQLLGASKDGDGVGCQWQAVGTAHLTRMAFGEEGGGGKQRIFILVHHFVEGAQTLHSSRSSKKWVSKPSRWTGHDGVTMLSIYRKMALVYTLITKCEIFS